MKYRISFWLWLGPLSMLAFVVVLLWFNRVAWGGLVALFYGGPLVAVIHFVASLVIVYHGYQRYQRKQRLGKRLCLALLYYLGLPVVLLLCSIYFAGFSQTLIMFKGLTQEIQYQIQLIK